MQVGLISLLDGLVYGMLLFMLASGLTLIFSMMGVLNFAHASIYMLGAYFAYQISQWVGFWPALIIAPLLCGADRRGDRGMGAAARASQRPHRRVAVHLRPGVHHRPRGADGLGHAADAIPRAGIASISRCSRSTARISRPIAASCCWSPAGMLFATWLLLKKTRIGLIIQAALTHPSMVSALGHNVPRVFTMVFAGGSLLAGLAGVIAGNYFTTESGMADAMGPIVFVVVIFGGLGSLAGCFIASILMGMVQTFSVVDRLVIRRPGQARSA